VAHWSGQGVPLDGYQMRYIYFLNPSACERLVPKEVPPSEIERRGAGMYRGIARRKQAMAETPPRHSGAVAATATLQAKSFGR
jgi:hypothetical protein